MGLGLRARCGPVCLLLLCSCVNVTLSQQSARCCVSLRVGASDVFVGAEERVIPSFIHWIVEERFPSKAEVRTVTPQAHSVPSGACLEPHPSSFNRCVGKTEGRCHPPSSEQPRAQHCPRQALSGSTLRSVDVHAGGHSTAYRPRRPTGERNARGGEPALPGQVAGGLLRDVDEAWGLGG